MNFSRETQQRYEQAMAAKRNLRPSAANPLRASTAMFAKPAGATKTSPNRSRLGYTLALLSARLGLRLLGPE
jgi:hypothetical protein